MPTEQLYDIALSNFFIATWDEETTGEDIELQRIDSQEALLDALEIGFTVYHGDKSDYCPDKPNKGLEWVNNEDVAIQIIKENYLFYDVKLEKEDTPLIRAVPTDDTFVGRTITEWEWAIVDELGKDPEAFDNIIAIMKEAEEELKTPKFLGEDEAPKRVTLEELFDKANEKTDKVNSPKHYIGEQGLEVETVLQNFIPRYTDAYTAHRVASALEYLLRAPEKNGVEDIKKARKNLDQALAYLEDITN